MATIKTYRHGYYHDEIVHGFMFTGSDDIDAVRELTGLHVHDIYMIDPNNPKAVTCAVSVPIEGTDCYHKIVIAPGYYLYKDSCNDLHTTPRDIFIMYYNEEEDTDGKHLDCD